MGTRGYRYKTSLSESGPGDGGKTGSWRVQRPILNTEQCTPAKRGTEACFICWLYCPDCVISRTIPPVIDYEYCKGCGICAEECPTKAITMIDEAEWHEGDNEPNGAPGRLRDDASPPESAGHAGEKDAGSANSSAIGATEDVVSRRSALSDGRGFVAQEPEAACSLDGARPCT